MVEGKSPFVKKKSKCPVCDNEATNRFFLPKIFMEKSVESDRHVEEYKWLDESFVDIHPPYYHFWHCPACKYTSSRADFLTPTKNRENNFSLLKRAFLKMEPSDKQVVQLLGGNVDFDAIDFEMALRVHLLAIFIQKLVDDDIQDTSKLGSYFLRAAWLFREQKATDEGKKKIEDAQPFLEKIAKLWEDIPKSEEECLIKAAEYYEKAYQGHPRYEDIVQATDLMLLIADLYKRAGDIKKVMNCVNVVMQTGVKTRAKQAELIRREQEKGKLTAARKAQIEASGNRLSGLMERGAELKQEITEIRIKQQMPKAQLLMKKMEGQDTEVIREKMKELNFEPQLITKLLGEPKKKKFLGLF